MHNTRIQHTMADTYSSGFTLIELIMSVVIGGMIMTMGVPSFSSFIKNNQLTTQVNDFVSTANIARTEAIKRKSRVVVCKSSSGTGCSSSSASWQSGWIAFVDTDNDNTVDAGEDIIAVKKALPEGATLKSNTTLTSGGSSGVAFFFDAKGRSSVVTGGTGELLVCDSRAALSHSKLVYLTSIGRIETISSPSSSDTSLTCA